MKHQYLLQNHIQASGLQRRRFLENLKLEHFHGFVDCTEVARRLRKVLASMNVQAGSASSSLPMMSNKYRAQGVGSFLQDMDERLPLLRK